MRRRTASGTIVEQAGHHVRVLSSRFVKAFNIVNNSDAADARAIWLAVQQPGKTVAVKTEVQQAVLAMHRMRKKLVKKRTLQINVLHGLMTEYEEVMGKNRAVLERKIPGVLHIAVKAGQRDKTN